MIVKMFVYVNGLEISRTHKGKAQASDTGTAACLSWSCVPSKKRQQTNAHDVRCTDKNCCTTACSGNKVAEARRPSRWHQESCSRNHKERQRACVCNNEEKHNSDQGVFLFQSVYCKTRRCNLLVCSRVYYSFL